MVKKVEFYWKYMSMCLYKQKYQWNIYVMQIIAYFSKNLTSKYMYFGSVAGVSIYVRARLKAVLQRTSYVYVRFLLFTYTYIYYYCTLYIYMLHCITRAREERRSYELDKANYNLV